MPPGAAGPASADRTAPAADSSPAGPSTAAIDDASDGAAAIPGSVGARCRSHCRRALPRAQERSTGGGDPGLAPAVGPGDGSTPGLQEAAREPRGPRGRVRGWPSSRRGGVLSRPSSLAGVPLGRPGGARTAGPGAVALGRGGVPRSGRDSYVRDTSVRLAASGGRSRDAAVRPSQRTRAVPNSSEGHSPECRYW